MKIILIIVAICSVAYGTLPKEDTRILTCEKNLTMVVSEAFGGYSCAAEVLAENSSYSKLPEKFVEVVNPRIAKIGLLTNRTAFHKWFCENFDLAYNISIEHPKFDFPTNQVLDFMECWEGIITESYREDVCVRKNIFAKKILIEYHKCIVSKVGKGAKCFEEIESFDDFEKLPDWFCANEDRPAKYISAITSCVMVENEISTCFDTIKVFE